MNKENSFLSVFVAAVVFSVVIIGIYFFVEKYSQRDTDFVEDKLEFSEKASDYNAGNGILNINNVNNIQMKEDIKQDNKGDVVVDKINNPIVVMETSKGIIKIELFMDKMPITAGNFKKLTENGYYDGVKFHRVIDNFMIQGGDPLSKDDTKEAFWGTGGPGYTIEDEFVEGLSNLKGTISMANSGPNTGGSQFFINTVDNVYLDFDKEPMQSKHPVFGRVIDGMDVVLSIERGDVMNKVYLEK